MLTCTRCREQLLDHLYGLLEPAELAAVEAHLAGCPECAAAIAAERKVQGLLAAAAKTAFPDVSFVPPTATADEPKVEPARPVRTARSTWLNWVVAAGLLLTVSAAGGPALVNTLGTAAYRSKVNAEQAKLDRIQAEQARLEQAVAERKKTADRQLEQAKADHEALERQWISAEAEVVKRLAEKPFLLDLQGPASAVAGAPNEYRVRVINADNTPVTDPVTVEAKVKDAGGAELHADKFVVNPAEPMHKFKLPSGVWSKVSAGEEVYLTVTATDRAGVSSDLTENLRLLEPVYTTFLTTDRPMYRPGETVYFRALTLDRTRFLPPERDQAVRFEIKAPSGEVLPGSQFIGLSRPVKPDAGGELKPVLGPDGQPIRGVSGGAFTLTGELAGGEYALNVYAVPAPGERVNPLPLATRKFIVNKYKPDALLKKLEFDGKSYGPGDVVQAKFDLKSQAQPLADATIEITAQADGQPVKLDAAPTKTGSDGTASLRFTLPKADEIIAANVSVKVTAKGTVETLVRPVPLATRRLTLEFFPEGGDLIAGVPNRVYFRATTGFGKPADVTGTLTDGVAAITTLQTLTDPDQPGANQGLGVFEFTPAAGKQYAVKLSKPANLIQPADGYRLPDAKAVGLALNVPTGVTKVGEPIKVKLYSPDKKRTVLLGAYVRGRAVAHTKVTVEPGKPAEADLNTGDVKLGGVTRVTAFDLPNDDVIGREDLKPLAERLVFRTPGEKLQLSYTTNKSNFGTPRSGSGHEPATSFVPGARVDLNIQSKDETGAAKPAILWAAVVNQSVITMADEKTERLLPTHFLLSGEVQKGEELEHADFLLTDHKKAAEALDLLLGTQGWRRFAEQGEFRKMAPADAEQWNRLQMVSSDSGPIPTGWRPAVRRVFDEYWPKYEAALRSLESAEQTRTRMYASGDDDRDLQRAKADYQLGLAQFAEPATELKGFADSWQEQRAYLPLVFGVLGALVLTAGIVRQGVFRAGSPERRTLGVAVLVLLGLMGSLTLMALYAEAGDQKWRDTYAIAPHPDTDRWGRKATGMAAPPAAMAADGAMPMADAGGMPKDAAAMGGGMGDMRPQAMPGGMPPAAARGFAPKAGQPPAPPAPAGGVQRMQMMKGVADPAKPKADAKGGGRDALDFREAVEDGKKLRVMDGVARLEKKKMEEMADMPGAGPRGGRGFARQSPQPQFNDFVRRRNAELAAVIQKEMNQPAGRGRNPLPQLTEFRPQYTPLPVREYAHTRPELADDAPREDFTETLLWQPVIVTPTDGKATVTFSLSDDVAPYRVLVAGHTLDGRIGAVSGVIEVRKPFALDPKLPQEISSSDVMDVPVIALNGSDAGRKADVSVSAVGLKVNGDEKFALDLAANAGGRKLVRLTPSQLDGELRVQLEGKASGDRDSVIRTLTVVPDGFPLSVSASDVLEQKVSKAFKLPEQIVPGTLKMKVSVYPNTLSEVQAGLEGMLREPYGCFEQTSTTNYPNVLILDYLNETNQAKPDVSKRAKELLDRGYGKLVSFECQKPQAGKEGYEWFGGTAPPHEALTAYGLLQFTDMARVHPVDAEMLKRTREYLLSARDGQGGFKKNARALDTFGYAPKPIADAYIVWAISESERKADAKSDLDKELAAVLAKTKEGDTAKDPYYLGLAANALLNRGKKADGEAVLKALAKMQQKDGSIPGAKTSITNSVGEALLIETTGMAVLGWLKANETGTYRENVDSACKWIGTKRGGYGGYGSTQSTILALKALIEYARSSKRPAENGTIRVFANGVEVGQKAFTTEQTGPIVIDIPDAEKVFAAGNVDVRVETDAKQAYPCTLAMECRSRKPDSSADCPIRLETTLNKAEAAEGDTVRLAVKVRNTKEKQNGMVTAIVGIPAGLKVPEDMKQLKLLTDRPADGKRPTVSYWEKRGRELVFYWHGLNENEAVEFGVDLIADIPGEYVGPAGRAYLYYGAEHKHWTDPVRVKVTAK